MYVYVFSCLLERVPEGKVRLDLDAERCERDERSY